MSSYDGIILGAGHNGLILAAYAARAGLRVLLIERRSVVGGGLMTLEDPRFPGVLHNTHAFFQRGITSMPWFGDLDLERHGLAYIQPELSTVLLTRDGASLEWWTDFQRTHDSFSNFSQRDAATLARWYEEFLPISREILSWEARSAPLEPARRRALLEGSAIGRRLLEVSALSPLEFVTQEFENPVIQAGLLFFNGLREVDLRQPGFGHHIAMLLTQSAKAQMSRGGTIALARALQASVIDAGGEIRTLTEPARIELEAGKVVGITTTTGEFIGASGFVASSLNPQQTFLDLMDPGLLPPGLREKADAFAYNLLAPLFSLNLTLSEPPHYRHAEGRPDIDKAFMVILGLDHADQFSDIVRHHQERTIPPTVMWGATPTALDPSQAPPGRHTAFMWEKVPYNLHGDPSSWDAERDRHGEEMLLLWSEYAPNLSNAVLGSFTGSPLDVERSLPNMRFGDLLVGALTNGQIGFDRPFTGAGQYRTAIAGLYLCGSSSHPGGNVTGLPGYNAAQTILADLGVATPWAPVSIAERLASLQ